MVALSIPDHKTPQMGIFVHLTLKIAKFTLTCCESCVRCKPLNKFGFRPFPGAGKVSFL